MTDVARLSDEQIAQIEKLNEIVFPHFWAKRVSLRDSPRKLVHYTSAENAVKILTDKTFMLRSTVCMNDYLEVQHGHGLVYKCFMDNDRALLRSFMAAFDQIYPGAASDAFALYDGHYKNNVFRTYVACLSEHDPDRDGMGRLSMWRAYGRSRAGVALVIDKTALFQYAPFPGFFFSPVAYLRDKEAQTLLEQVVERASEEREFLSSLTRDQIVSAIFVLLMFSAICIKHHAFEEEREWRLIYLPGIFKSELMIETSITIEGVPQPVFKLPLLDSPEKGLVGMEIPALLEQIIVGPTQYPFPITEALASVLEKCGVQNPMSRITTTNIPLRM